MTINRATYDTANPSEYMKKFKKMKVNKSILLVIIILLGIGIYFMMKNKAYRIDENKISASSIIEYPSKFNYRQTLNDCGPFNVAAVVRSLTKTDVDSQEFARTMKWRLPNKYTLPWGMEKQLKENSIDIETPNVQQFSDEDKILFLKEQLSLGNPIIILGGRDNYQHYLTIFGFESSQDEFYTYDSLFDKGENALTKDANSTLPGNRNFTSTELLDFWRKGGMYGFYNWYAIVAHQK